MTVLPPEPNQRPVREPLRDDPRGIVGRNGEILRRNYRADDLPSQFDIPLEYQEPGWSLQWVRLSCHNKEDPQNYNVHYANGWRPVPASRIPNQFGSNSADEHIVRDGLILMERPEIMTRQAEQESRVNARRQKHNTTAEFTGVDKVLRETDGAHQGTFAPANNKTDSRGQAAARVNRTLEGAPTSLYPRREFDLGDEE